MGATLDPRLSGKISPESFSAEHEDGAVFERRYTPINSVAITVPGNMAPLFSTLYMNLIPAIVAGVPNITVLTKPGIDGTIDQHLLYAADYLNVKAFIAADMMSQAEHGTGFMR